MLGDGLQLSWQDILSVILTGLATAIGVSFTFLPAPLPGPLSLLTLAGLAIFLASISALLQASSLGRPNQESQKEGQKDSIELPREIYEQQLDQSYRSGLYEGRYRGLQQGRAKDNRGSELRDGSEKHPMEQRKNSSTSNIEKEIEKLKNQVKSIKSSNRMDDSAWSQIGEIESKIESMEEDVEELRGQSVSNFEFSQKEKELKKRIEDNRMDLRTLYQIIKENVEDFEPPKQEDSNSKESTEELSSNEEKNIGKEEEVE